MKKHAVECAQELIKWTRGYEGRTCASVKQETRTYLMRSPRTDRVIEAVAPIEGTKKKCEGRYTVEIEKGVRCAHALVVPERFYRPFKVERLRVTRRCTHCEFKMFSVWFDSNPLQGRIVCGQEIPF